MGKSVKRKSIEKRRFCLIFQCFFGGDPAGIRTPDTLLKRQVLCRLSYWIVFGWKNGWDGGIRTHECRSQSPVPYRLATSHRSRPPLKDLRAGDDAPTLSPCIWGGIWGSNPRHPEPQSGALPAELIPPYLHLARQEGLEPPAYCLEGSCSIRLSYWRI